MNTTILNVVICSDGTDASGAITFSQPVNVAAGVEPGIIDTTQPCTFVLDAASDTATITFSAVVGPTVTPGDDVVLTAAPLTQVTAAAGSGPLADSATTITAI